MIRFMIALLIVVLQFTSGTVMQDVAESQPNEIIVVADNPGSGNCC